MDAAIVFETEALSDAITLLRRMARAVALHPTQARLRWQARLVDVLAGPDGELLLLRPVDGSTLAVCLGDALTKLIVDGRGLGLHVEEHGVETD